MKQADYACAWYAGCCFLVGGTQFHEQSFNAGFNKVSSTCTCLSTAPRSRSCWSWRVDAQAHNLINTIPVLIVVCR